LRGGYWDLSASDKRGVLIAAEQSSRQMVHLLEKDIWVVATLRILFEAPFADHLTDDNQAAFSQF